MTSEYFAAVCPPRPESASCAPLQDLARQASVGLGFGFPLGFGSSYRQASSKTFALFAARTVASSAFKADRELAFRCFASDCCLLISPSAFDREFTLACPPPSITMRKCSPTCFIFASLASQWPGLVSFQIRILFLQIDYFTLSAKPPQHADQIWLRSGYTSLCYGLPVRPYPQ